MEAALTRPLSIEGCSNETQPCRNHPALSCSGPADLPTASAVFGALQSLYAGPVRGQQVQDFLLQSFAAGTEGLMLKRLDADATYQPSKRSESWIKIKR